MPRNPVNDIRAEGALRLKASSVSGPADEFESITLIDPSGVISQIGNQGSARSRVYGDGRKWTPIQPALPGSLVAGQYFIETIGGNDYWVYVDSFGVPHSVSGPGGADTQVQFNDGGVLNGDSGFTYDKTTDQLTMTQAGSTSIKLSRITANTGIVTVGAIGDRSGANTFDALQLGNGAGTGGLSLQLFDTGGADFSGVGLTTQINLNLPVAIMPGTAGAPSVAFLADLDTGIYQVAANDLGVSTGGALRLDVSTTAITSTLINVLPAATTAQASARLPHGVAPTSPVDGDEWTTTAGLFIRINGVTVGPLANGSGNVTGTAVAGQVTYWTGASGVAGDAGMVYDDVNNQLALASGTAALPAYSIVGDLNTGWYGPAADTFGIATGGTLRLSVDMTSVTSTVSILLPAGLLASPALSFAADTDTGFYWIGANNIGLSVGGVAIMDATTTVVTINGKLTVTGLIDPTGLALTPVAANPGGGLAASTLWANSLDSNKLYYGATLAGQGTTGTGVANQVTYWSGTSTLTGTTTFVFTPAGDGALLAGASLTLNAASATTSRSINFQVGGVGRWIQRATGAESGGDSGSNFELLARTDAGAAIDSPITIVRAAGGTMTFTRQAIGPSGSVALPSWSFSGDPDTGMYSVGANDIGFSTGSTLRLDISTTALTATLPFLATDGAASTPSVSFSSDVNTGIYWIGADNFGFTTGGTKRLDISTTQISSTLPIVMTGTTATGVTVTGSVDATFGHTGAQSLHLETNGVDAITIDSGRICTFSQQILGATGSATAPSYSFTGDANTGVYWIGADHIGVTVGGTLRLDATTTLLTSTLTLLLPAGSAASPAMAFSTDTNTGVYSVGADDLGLSVGGALRLDVSTTAITSTLPIYAPAGSAGTPSFSISTDINTGVYSVGADDLGIATNGILRLDVSTVAVTSTLQLLGPTGSAALPTYGFAGGAGFGGLGMYRVGVGSLGFSTGSTLQLTIDGSRFTAALPFGGPAQSAADPTFSVGGGANGMYLAAANTVGICSNATQRMIFDNLGSVVIGTAAILTTATDGFLYIPTCAGTPTGVPTVYTGRSPVVIDSTNNKLYFYSGGSWRDAGP